MKNRSTIILLTLLLALSLVAAGCGSSADGEGGPGASGGSRTESSESPTQGFDRPVVGDVPPTSDDFSEPDDPVTSDLGSPFAEPEDDFPPILFD